MSYIMAPRLSFGGRFMSDVSTRNNIDANYRLGATQTNLWNAAGGSSFEFLDCRVLSDIGVADDDPAAGYVLTGALDRPSAKMVDLDPDQQGVSEIWGLRVRIGDPASGDLALEGHFEVSPFRGLWRRQTTVQPNRQPLGARWVSVVRDLHWGPAAHRSERLSALRAATQEDTLSIGMHSFGYFYPDTEARYRTGTTMVHIGPFQSGEPDTTLMHRRIESFAISQGPGQPPLEVVGAIDFAISEDGTRSWFDLGQAMLVQDVDGTLAALSSVVGGLERVSIGLVPDPEPAFGSPVTGAEIVLDLPTAPDWYRTTGGVIEVDLPAAIAADAPSRRLALFAHMRDGSTLLLSTETRDGIFFRADNIVHRMDPGDEAKVRIHARKFGKPLAGLTLQTATLQGTPTGPGLGVTASATTNAAGLAEITLSASDPGKPRAANDLDGQVFRVAYALSFQSPGVPALAGTGLGFDDVISVHVREPFPVPDAPEYFRDIRPIMRQYAQLYPIMSVHLFDISAYEALVQHRKTLLLAFGRHIGDPNYMPVTRDMSAGRMATLVKWLSTETGDPDNPLKRDMLLAAAPEPELAAAAAPAEAPEDAKGLIADLRNRAPHVPVLTLSA